MGRTRGVRTVELSPQEAFELWTDVSRWPTFVEGFARVDRIDPAWPERGATIVWRSLPTGRGVVTENVVVHEPSARFATTVFEERLSGTQTLEFTAAEDGRTEVAMELDYELAKGGPLRPLMDLFFIRRAQSDAIFRTLRRFATEAAEQAAL